MSPYTRAMAVAEHWLRTPHWSTDIPLDSPHPRLDVLAERGFVVLRDLEPAVPESEYLALEYMDWKSGGDTNFAPIATADGELECRGFWKEDDQRPDKGGRFTSNAALCPTLVAEVQSVGADFGRVRTIKLEPQGYDDALRQIHRDDNNRFNPDDEGWVVRSWTELTDFPDSFMILMEQGPDGLPDPATEVRLPLHRGARFVLDTQRLWHVVCHPADAPRYALIASYESGPALDALDRVATALIPRSLPASRDTRLAARSASAADRRRVVDDHEPARAVVHEDVRDRGPRTGEVRAVGSRLADGSGCLEDVLLGGDPRGGAGNRVLLVGEHELDEAGVAEDGRPRLLDARPPTEHRPPRVRHHDPFGVLPDVAHQVDVARLERGVERGVRRDDLLAHVRAAAWLVLQLAR